MYCMCVGGGRVWQQLLRSVPLVGLADEGAEVSGGSGQHAAAGSRE